MTDEHQAAELKERTKAFALRVIRLIRALPAGIGPTMIEAKTIWTDNERFLGSATSGHALVMDAGKEKTANSPMELVLIALCGCTASDVVGVLRKKREPFTGLEVQAKGERATGYPSVYTQIHLTYRVRGQVSPKAMEDAVHLSKEKYCSVSAMLGKTAKITCTIEHVA